jgi:hypothetical protein
MNANASAYVRCGIVSSIVGAFLAILPCSNAQLRLLDQEESAARLPLLTKIDFEELRPRPPGVFRTGGIIFTNYRVSRCSAPACAPDPGNTNDVNMVVAPAGGDKMVFSGVPRFVVLEMVGAAGPFALRVRDAAGQQYMLENQIPESGSKLLGMEATYGVQRIDVVSFEPGPLAFAAIFVHGVATPMRLMAKALWSTQVNLTWRHQSSGQTSFAVERSADSRSNFVQIAEVGAGTNSFKDLAVSPRTRYFYRVRANHPVGESAYSNEAFAQTGGRESRALFRSIGGEDGTVCENIEIANRGETVLDEGSGGDALLVGDLHGDQQCKAFISFDTSSLPNDARIVSAVVRVRQGTRQGNATDLGPLRLDISGGGFGGTPMLSVSDFEAAPDGLRVGTLTRAQPSGWRTAQLNRTGLAQINKDGRTQFRLYFGIDDNDNFSADNVGFFSGEAERAQNRPVLEIIYRGAEPASPSE